MENRQSKETLPFIPLGSEDYRILCTIAQTVIQWCIHSSFRMVNTDGNLEYESKGELQKGKVMKWRKVMMENSRAEQQDLRPGRIIILPSSFTSGKHAMTQNYQDAMTLVAKFGKPDLFITFICNPKWEEIQSGLLQHETAIDCPDLVSTIFHLKLQELLNDLTAKKGGVMGQVKAYTYVIEFQKRGLLHCHMLLILDDEDKFREAIDCDKAVYAEIPDPDINKEVYDVVTSCMIHGPCGEHNRNSPCMEDVKGIRTCSKKFPKDFSEETNINVDGYPVYRRQKDGIKLQVRDVEVDSRSVVPYNPYLSQKYSAHINEKICSSIQTVKYIFKYMYKGHDAAIVQVNKVSNTGTYHWDEIKTYIDTGYLASPEAMWWLRKFEMSARSHAVERLPVHLPFQQSVYFEDGME
ncbi:uncharacterized protein [Dendrobates tinctorius]|uniref:uncharacterized protein n=1 Tax=Dendrobates tinctorius TaxID=92724 RepID=UPI003CC94F27